MDFGLREWLIVAGIIVICGILIDGWRRMRGSRNRLTLRVDRSATKLSESSAEPELLGPSRVVERGREKAAEKHEPRIEPAPRREAPVRREPLVPAEPALEDDAPSAAAPLSGAARPPEPALAVPPAEAAVASPAPVSARPVTEPAPQAPTAPMLPLRPAADVSAPELERARTEEGRPQPLGSDLPSRSSALRSDAPAAAERCQERTPRSEAAPAPVPDDVLVITVVSRDSTGFKGPQLLDNIVASGLRAGDPLGERDVFHRYESLGGTTPLFSMVNALKPGTFDMDNLETFSTRAVTFYLTLPGPRHPKEAFNMMLEAARRLAEGLQGDLKDEQRSVLTGQTIEHYRQRIADYERRARMNRR
ncbi:cell division protein ZipA [Pseudomonas sp. NW5]|uniref:cell division protein ZipA n=1 Tax=Pseudomonas sp. NW5 TaxID=2934934 RepID=UPI002021A722|nr:cell division protein ZipA [Pseudomonas sp. NW5]MCL7461695.1 cell division protein ZipA [Pseudomonas sp. NW5]